MNKTNITYATEADWPAIKKLNDLYDYHNPEAFMKEAIKDQRVLVSKVEGKTTGYLLWQILWGNTPFLALLKILPEHQRQKHGTQLVKHFEDKMKQAGFENYISSSIGTNYEALAFIKAINCQEGGSVQMPYGNEIFYSKGL